MYADFFLLMTEASMLTSAEIWVVNLTLILKTLWDEKCAYGQTNLVFSF